MGKALEKQTKNMEEQEKKQIKAIEDHGKYWIESNSVISRNNFNIDRDGVPFEKQKEIFSELLTKRAHEFDNSKNKISPNKLIYKFKTEGDSPEDFKDYWKPSELFENLRHGHLDSKEVLKSQIKFKLDLNEVKKENQKLLNKCFNGYQ